MNQQKTTMILNVWQLFVYAECIIIACTYSSNNKEISTVFYNRIIILTLDVLGNLIVTASATELNVVLRFLLELDFCVVVTSPWRYITPWYLLPTLFKRILNMFLYWIESSIRFCDLNLWIISTFSFLKYYYLKGLEILKQSHY